jgi:hypothetical protein
MMVEVCSGGQGMSRILIRTLLSIILFTLGIGSAAGAVLAGFATADITPPLNLEMAGFGPFLERKATGIHDPLMAHAMVMEVNGMRVAVVDCDVAGVTLEFTYKVRELVEAGTGIPGQHVLITATHTHSGPAIPHWIGWGAQDPEYLKGLPQKVAGAITAASMRLHPVAVYYGEVPVEGIGDNREYDGGPVDLKLRALKFMRGDKLEGFIVNYSVHNVILSEQMHEYSADLTGVALAKLVQENPGSVGIFLQGSCGDINPRPAHQINNQPPEKCLRLLNELSEAFAGYARKALASASPLDIRELEMETKKISLPEVPTDRALALRTMQMADGLLQRGGLPPGAERQLRWTRDTSRAALDRFNRLPLDSRETEIQALRIQDLLILTDPGELFITFANQIGAALPNWKVWVAGYANDYIGYIPTPDRYDLQDEHYRYAAYFTPLMDGEFRYREDVGDVLVRDMVALAQEVTVR